MDEASKIFTIMGVIIFAIIFGIFGTVVYFAGDQQQRIDNFILELKDQNYTVLKAEFNSPPIYVICETEQVFIAQAEANGITTIYHADYDSFYAVMPDFKTAFKYTVP